MLSIESPTPEGLVVEEIPADNGWTTVREVGKLDYVVWEYRAKEVGQDQVVFREVAADPVYLLERIADLERLCSRLRGEGATSIELSQHRWNLKRAKRRFRRWYQEDDSLSLDASPHLRPLVEMILAEAPDQATGPADAMDFISEAYTTGDIGVLEDYVRRKWIGRL